MDCLREAIKRHFSPTISDPESQADGDSQEILKLAKEMLLQGLIDENAELQWVNSVVMTIWSDESLDWSLFITEELILKGFLSILIWKSNSEVKLLE